MNKPSRSGTDLGGSDTSWRSRPLLGATLGGLLVIAPLAVALLSGLLISRVLPPADGSAAAVPRAVAALGGSLLALVTFERLARRLMPLNALLRLTLMFPDRAPSRLGLALRTSSTRRLRAWVDQSGDQPSDVSPAHQAQRVLTLAAALNAHDHRTRGHSERVRALTELVAEELRLAPDASERLQWAALLHDVGKLAVPSGILNKPGKPTPHEWDVLRRHPARGAQIAKPLHAWLGEWAPAISEHHEKWDGTGYPLGLRATQISLSARIVSVTDAFETMTAVRSYKKPLSAERARNELTRCAGSHFDPGVVRAFLNVSLGRVRRRLGLASALSQVWLLGPALRAGAATGRRLATLPMRTIAVSLSALTLGSAVMQVAFSGSEHGSHVVVAGHESAGPRRAQRLPAAAASSAPSNPVGESPGSAAAVTPFAPAGAAAAVQGAPGGGGPDLASPPLPGRPPPRRAGPELALNAQVGTVRIDVLPAPPTVTRTDEPGVEVHTVAGGLDVTTPPRPSR